MNEYKEPGLPSKDWNKELIQDIFLSMYQMHLDGISQEERPRPDGAPSPKVEATEQDDLFATIRAAGQIPNTLGGRSQNLRDNKLLNKEIAAAKLKKSKEPPPPPPETKWETETDSPHKILLTIMIFAILLISSLFGYVSFMQDKQIEQCVNQDPNVKDCPTKCKRYTKDRGDMPCACYDTTAYKDAPVRCVK